MTPTNPQEKRTMEERAQKIVQICIDKCEPYRTEAIAAALEQACAEAYAKGKVDGMEVKALMGKGLNEAFLDGQAVMREKVSGMISVALSPWDGNFNRIHQTLTEIRTLPLEPPK